LDLEGGKRQIHRFPTTALADIKRQKKTGMGKKAKGMALFPELTKRDGPGQSQRKKKNSKKAGVTESAAVSKEDYIKGKKSREKKGQRNRITSRKVMRGGEGEKKKKREILADGERFPGSVWNKKNPKQGKRRIRGGW